MGASFQVEPRSFEAHKKFESVNYKPKAMHIATLASIPSVRTNDPKNVIHEIETPVSITKDPTTMSHDDR